MTTKINRKLALELLDRAVKEKGEEYIVPHCVYFADQGSPACIVGHALSYVGVESDNFLGSMGNHEIITDLSADFLGVELTPKAYKVFARAQEIQDGREKENPSWGNAVKVTHKEFDK